MGKNWRLSPKEGIFFEADNVKEDFQNLLKSCLSFGGVFGEF